MGESQENHIGSLHDQGYRTRSNFFATSALAADMTDKVMLSKVQVSKGSLPAIEGVAKNNTGVTYENFL